MVTGQDSWCVLENLVSDDLEVVCLPFNEGLPREWAGWRVMTWFETESEANAFYNGIMQGVADEENSEGY
jgi:hypothetical protein